MLTQGGRKSLPHSQLAEPLSTYYTLPIGATEVVHLTTYKIFGNTAFKE